MSGERTRRSQTVVPTQSPSVPQSQHLKGKFYTDLDQIANSNFDLELSNPMELTDTEGFILVYIKSIKPVNYKNSLSQGSSIQTMV
ncbi:MAG: hypothetical protein ACJBCI_06460 [Candidatus Tisiphia sp.]